ncbi:yemanuclein [Scaptodrosophila lebanonensis]|uniref:Yemanuclein n=1 Tax=Drosophila lebanonensis TaxID=7225 RepID=A0A6J2T1K0_DROLE|nr:yemanuclein [Scaptodrosophila lebanonensis]
MSKTGESKRVSLTTISQSLASSSLNNEAGLGAMPAFSRFGEFLAPEAPAPGKNNSSKNSNKCVRLNLELFETDSTTYPEFNFSKLVHLEKKKAKKSKVKTNSGDPFADNDDDVARIAKEMENKYGNAYASGRGRRKDDFCDIGMGYDESDSFIDNTDAYDEVVPEDVETIAGGFYINSGALEFKNLTKRSYTTRTDAIIKMPERSRKRVLSSSSEESSSSEDDDDDEDEDDDEEDDDDDDENDSESESLDDEDDGPASAKSKKKYKSGEKRSKSSISTKQKDNKLNLNNKKPSKKLAITTSSSSNSPRPSVLETSDTDERQAQALKKVVKTTTVKDMLKAKRDSFLKSQGDNAVKGVVNGEVKCTSTDVETSSENGGTDSATEQGARADKHTKGKEITENLRSADTILPPTLDVELLSCINTFKEIVRSRDMCGKLVFDDKLTALLLKIDEALLCFDRNERNMVFAHLEYQLTLPKYFILRKSKALRAKEEKNKTTLALDNLRKAIAKIMPRAIENYEIKLRKYAELQAGELNAEHPPKLPRKKFQWNTELRELLYEVYQARWTSYAVLGKRKDSLEEFINGYMKEKVVDIWAKGWMTYEELQREIDRHKAAIKEAKEKNKKLIASCSTTTSTCASPLAVEELATSAQSRSCANSDTDSATSASSNSLKRKLKEASTTAAPSPKQIAKAPRIRKVQKTTNQTAVPHLDTLLEMPSTSAQAAALNAAMATTIDLASPPKKTDHSIFNIMTPPIVATTNSMAVNSNLQQQQVQQPLHSKIMPHVINLDDYKSPSDILHTSKQLAATNYTTTAGRGDGANWQASVGRRESSSESDCVEVVGVFPAAAAGKSKAPTKSRANHKTKTVPTATVPRLPQVSANGTSLGFSMDNLYMFNNNTNLAGATIASTLNAVSTVDLMNNPQIMQTLSELKKLEKKRWSAPSTHTLPAGGSLKGANTGAGAGASTHQ